MIAYTCSSCPLLLSVIAAWLFAGMAAAQEQPAAQIEYAILRTTDGVPIVVPYQHRGENAVVNGVLTIGRADQVSDSTQALLKEIGMTRASLEGGKERQPVVMEAFAHRPELTRRLMLTSCYGAGRCWPDTHIYYEINIDDKNQKGRTMKEVIEDGLRQIELASGNRWKFCAVAMGSDQAKRLKKRRLHFIDLNFDDDDHCASTVGYSSGPVHEISIYPDCGPGPNLGPGYTETYTVAHEVMHALGMWHAHQNPRAAPLYMRVLEEKIVSAEKLNFRVPTADAFWQEYDFCSVMHYSWRLGRKYFPEGTRPEDMTAFAFGTNPSEIEAALQLCRLDWNKARPGDQIPMKLTKEQLVLRMVGQRWFISDYDKQVLAALAQMSNSGGTCGQPQDFNPK